MNKTKEKHQQAMKQRSKVRFGKGGIDLMLLAEPKESRAALKKDVDFWLKRNPIGIYDNMGNLRREWRK